MWNQDASPKPRNEATPAIASRPLDERRIVAWIGKSVIFKGDLIGSEDLTIDGRVEGTIELRDHALTIGPSADIRANIVAKTVTVRGAVTGTITAGAKVEVCDTGSIEGNIISPRFSMVDGAVLRGRVDTVTRHAETNNLQRLAAVS